jgi:CysZ protein
VIKALRNIGTGLGFLARGFGIVLGSPRLLLRGALPALLTLVLLSGAMVTLLIWIDELAALVTPFASDWSESVRTTVRIGAGISIVGAVVAVSLLSFTALTLAIGAPFYESIAEAVEERLGGVPDGERAGTFRVAMVGIADGLRLVGLSLLLAIPLLLLGFVPVLGQTVVPVLAVCVGAWLLGLEFTGIPFNRRGHGLAMRHRTLRRHGLLVLGFAVPVYLLCLIPFAVLVVTPAAMAGGTLLAHRVLTGVQHSE